MHSAKICDRVIYNLSVKMFWFFLFIHGLRFSLSRRSRRRCTSIWSRCVDHHKAPQDTRHHQSTIIPSVEFIRSVQIIVISESIVDFFLYFCGPRSKVIACRRIVICRWWERERVCYFDHVDDDDQLLLESVSCSNKSSGNCTLQNDSV